MIVSIAIRAYFWEASGFVQALPFCVTISYKAINCEFLASVTHIKFDPYYSNIDHA